MDYEAMLEKFKTWRRDELIYRDYYHMKHDLKSQEELLAKYPDDSGTTEIALHPENIASFSQEDTFICSCRNVSIIKHPRYIPVFYHEHAFFEMIYVLSGECTQRFREQQIQLKAGDLCLMAPNVVHGIEAIRDDCVILNILIRRSTFLDIFYNTVRDKSQISLFFIGNIYAKRKIRFLIFHTDSDTLIRNYILDMYQEQENADEFSDRIICSQLTIFFTQLTRRHREHLEIPDARKERSEYESALINYIISNCSTVTLNSLAEQFHFSVPYCSKLIKSISGMTFTSLLTNIRLQQGEQLLMLSQLSVEDISDKVGYKNPESFIRAFKRQYNMTPSQYRKYEFK